MQNSTLEFELFVGMPSLFSLPVVGFFYGCRLTCVYVGACGYMHFSSDQNSFLLCNKTLKCHKLMADYECHHFPHIFCFGAGGRGLGDSTIYFQFQYLPSTAAHEYLHFSLYHSVFLHALLFLVCTLIFCVHPYFLHALLVFCVHPYFLCSYFLRAILFLACTLIFMLSYFMCTLLVFECTLILYVHSHSLCAFRNRFLLLPTFASALLKVPTV